MRVRIILSIFCALMCKCQSYKILGVFPMPSYSHYKLSHTILVELARRGHEITLVTPFPAKTPIVNITEISVASIVGDINEKKEVVFRLGDKSIFEIVRAISQVGYTTTRAALRHENVQRLLNQDKQDFDLVFLPQLMNEALLGIGYHFKAPVVLLTSMQLFPWGSFNLAHPSPPSYVPNVLTDYTGHMSFWQRLLNTYYDLFTILYYQWEILPNHRQLVREYIPGGPDLYDFINNSSLLLINSHVSSYEATPRVPNTIEIGGIHLEEPKPLKGELKKFMDESKQGVVVFSMGSNLKSSALPQYKLDAILAAFSKLEQNVLWKWEADVLPGQPSNVKLMKWLPQNDVLAHPNVKAFVTHGGLLSTMEGIYHGVPIIGIPVFADQKMNMAQAAGRGYAALVPFEELTEEKLSEALHQVLNVPKYKENVLKLSRMMKDQPIKPMEKAIYWIEYVVRHEGARHLRYPGMDLNWFQRNLLDVIAFVLLSLVFVFGLVRLVVRKFAERICKNCGAHKKTE